jgi:hypothetical protein
MFWASTVDDGRRFGHHCCWWTSKHHLNIEVDKHKLIFTLFYRTYQNRLMAALTKVCARLPAPWEAWIHQIHAARGVGGFTTMVVVFVVCLCVVVDGLVTSQAHHMSKGMRK